VIRQQLQRHHVQQRAECTVVFGHADDMQAFAAFDVAVGVGQHVEDAATGADFLHIAFEFFEQGVVGSDRHHGHLAGDQGQGAMFEFAGGVGLCVDVADLFEFEGAFQRDGVVQAAAEEERVFHFGEVFGPADDLGLEGQHGLQGGGQVAHGFEVAGFFFVAELAFALGQGQGEQKEAGELGGESLGGGDADLDAGAGDVGELALAHHR